MRSSLPRSREAVVGRFSQTGFSTASTSAMPILSNRNIEDGSAVGGTERHRPLPPVWRALPTRLALVVEEQIDRLGEGRHALLPRVGEGIAPLGDGPAGGGGLLARQARLVSGKAPTPCHFGRATPRFCRNSHDLLVGDWT